MLVHIVQGADSRLRADQQLTDGVLTCVNLVELYEAQQAYIVKFGEVSWRIHKFVEIRGHQSPRYQALVGAKGKALRAAVQQLAATTPPSPEQIVLENPEIGALLGELAGSPPAAVAPDMPPTRVKTAPVETGTDGTPIGKDGNGTVTDSAELVLEKSDLKSIL